MFFRKRFLNIAVVLICDKCFIRFLFDKNKRYYRACVNIPPNKKEEKSIVDLIKYIGEKFNMDFEFNMGCKKDEEGEYHLTFSKDDILYVRKNYHIKLGKYFNIPKCCLKKYLREQGNYKITSYNSAKRYLNQCNYMRIKEDIFKIGISHRGAECSEYGFVPCSPKCKEALRIAKITNDMQNRVFDSLK